MLFELLRYLHFFMILGIAGGIVVENIAIQPTITPEDVENLIKVNTAYQICLILALLIGLILWFGIGKGSSFYSENPLFLVKIGLFTLLALLSTFPSFFYRKNKDNSEKMIPVPSMIPLILKAELALLLIIPVFAFLMARGIGLPS
jgi:putative membrane protein